MNLSSILPYINVLASILTLIAVLIALFTLFVAIEQTTLANNSLKIAEESIQFARTSRQLEMLPAMHHVINVRCAIEQWQRKLQKCIEALKNKDDEALKQVSIYAPKEAKALLVKDYITRETPDWLINIILSAAQYYYDAACNFKTFYKNDKKCIENAHYSSWLECCEQSHSKLAELLQLIINEVPDVLLTTPASIKDSDFLQ